MNWLLNESPSLGSRDHFINGETICELESIFAKILWVIQYTINHGHIRECASILAKIQQAINNTCLNYGLIHEWVLAGLCN